MMKYIISYTEPHHHYIDIEFIVEDVTSTTLQFQLPSWRPGRYELGNFAKNVQKWVAFNQAGQPLKYTKISKDLWEVQTENATAIHIKYNYYAADLNAGSTFLDESVLYMNPVNCCIYVPGRIQEQCLVELQLPADYSIACGLNQEHVSDELKRISTLTAANFHELADSPFIASPSLKHSKIVVDNTDFHLWFQGECMPVWEKINRDFSIFIAEQINTMKSFPAECYHFLFHLLPYRMYHGVEHLNSTVIALGPSYSLMRNDLYIEFLGVSSHELFHAWNIKAIRPIEMQPYDYTKENYSRLGYVCEGITTYYGDFYIAPIYLMTTLTLPPLTSAYKNTSIILAGSTYP
jgi:predicted metalloprotease with PDZ domain